VFWVISVYFNIRNTLPKSGTFLLGHPVYIHKKRPAYFWMYFSKQLIYKHTYKNEWMIYIYKVPIALMGSCTSRHLFYLREETRGRTVDGSVWRLLWAAIRTLHTEKFKWSFKELSNLIAIWIISKFLPSKCARIYAYSKSKHNKTAWKLWIY